MSGKMEIAQSFDWTSWVSGGGRTVESGTAELSVVIRCNGDHMPDGSALSLRVRELFTQALGAALRTEDLSATVVRKERG